jgi:hypothetical protein
MKRALAIAALASIGFVAPFIPMTASSAAENNVTMVQGLWGVNVDVYVDGTLVIQNWAYGGQQAIPLEGNGNILVCFAQDPAPATTEDCAPGTIAIPVHTYGNIDPDVSYTVVAGFEDTGAGFVYETALLLFEDDLSCSNGQARVSLYNAAVNDPVEPADAAAGAFTYATQVDNGEQEGASHPAPDADVTISIRSSGNGNPVLEDIAQQTAPNQNTITILTGTGLFGEEEGVPYDILYRRMANDPCPSTSTTVTSTTVQAVSVTPKFTG